MITTAEKNGELTKDKIILEPTSGNTGIGLAMVAAVKGYRLLVTMPESMSEERRKILEAFGAEIILTPGERGTDGAIEKARQLYAGNPELYFMPDRNYGFRNLGTNEGRDNPSCCRNGNNRNTYGLFTTPERI
jgi:cysteine synthase